MFTYLSWILSSASSWVLPSFSTPHSIMLHIYFLQWLVFEIMCFHSLWTSCYRCFSIYSMTSFFHRPWQDSEAFSSLFSWSWPNFSSSLSQKHEIFMVSSPGIHPINHSLFSFAVSYSFITTIHFLLDYLHHTSGQACHLYITVNFDRFAYSSSLW